MSEHSSSQAEAFLFAEGGPIARRKLAGLLGVDQTALKGVLTELSRHLEGRGIALIETETEVSLAVAPQAADAVQKATQEALGRDIGEAGLEVLSIVLYRGASTKAQIDYIRGVNTGSTIRSLLTRGLLERTENPADGREYLYRPTTELLAHLGIRNAQELPEYDTIRGELAAFERTQEMPFGKSQDHAGISDTATQNED